MTQDPNAPQQPDYQGGTQQPEPYPTGGQAYPASGQEAPGSGPLTPPPPLALAVKLMYLGAALAVVSALSTVLFADQLRQQLLADPAIDESIADVAVTSAIVFGIVVGLISAGLWVLNAIFNAKGKKWARILSSVLAALAVVSTLASLVQPAPIASRVLSFLQVVLAIGIVVLLWKPESSRFYEAASAPRR